MSDDDPAQVLRRLIDLANLAASPNEHEAASAARNACRIVRDHGESFRIQQAGAPGRGTVHPLAALLAAHGIRPDKASEAGWCLRCGEMIEQGANVAVHDRVGSTHYACREWWRDFDFARLPPEEINDVRV